MSKYYPLVDADSSRLNKVPLFPANRIADALGKSNFALSEIAPHRYALLAMKTLNEDPDQYHIHCPMCGIAMAQVVPYKSDHLLGEYTCENCNKEIGGKKMYHINSTKYERNFWDAMKRKNSTCNGLPQNRHRMTNSYTLPFVQSKQFSSKITDKHIWIGK